MSATNTTSNDAPSPAWPDDAPQPGAIYQGDCVELLKQLPDSSLDLVFADPPFNIGFEYDTYEDKHEDEVYLAWCESWISQIFRTLKVSGSFWLAIGDEYAAELRVAAKRIGFQPRNWVVWYYTFGQNCRKKFNRSHAHLFHFVKDEAKHTFNYQDPQIRVPSARALVYGDRRANATGRLPDDTWMLAPQQQEAADPAAPTDPAAPAEVTAPAEAMDWVLRPQDLQEHDQSFHKMDDTWYFSRVAGTFKEREGFHGCQMPEQLLGRIVRVSSNEGDVVLDPFSGSGTTLSVAKKLGREWLGFELSTDYVKYGNERLERCSAGDTLNGPADPVRSAPKTAAGRRLKGHPMTEQKELFATAKTESAGKEAPAPTPEEPAAKGTTKSAEPVAKPAPAQPGLSLKELTHQALIEAFTNTHQGRSVDWLLCDPTIQEAFHKQCTAAGLIGGPSDWNHELVRLRKSGKLPKLKLEKHPVEAALVQQCAFAAEIAWRLAQRKYPGFGLDELFVSPGRALWFDRTAAKELGRSVSSLLGPAVVRWSALKQRKAQHQLAADAKQYHYVLGTRDFQKFQSLARFNPKRLENVPGVYLLRSRDKSPLYVGETENLGERLALHSEAAGVGRLATQVSVLLAEELPSDSYRLPLWVDLIWRYSPRLNQIPAKPIAD